MAFSQLIDGEVLEKSLIAPKILEKTSFLLFLLKIPIYIYRVASRPGISGNLEKSGNFMALEKSQGNVREFRENQKSQGIIMQNWKKSGNFICAKQISPKFFQDSFKC